MSVFSQEFKVQSVEKALSRRPEQSLKQIAVTLGVGYSTLQKWIRLAKKNQLEKTESNMSKEKSPQDWNTVERFEAIVHCHHLTDDQASAYCREQGIYLHHLNTWKAEFCQNLNQQNPYINRRKQNSNKKTSVCIRS